MYILSWLLVPLIYFYLFCYKFYISTTYLQLFSTYKNSKISITITFFPVSISLLLESISLAILNIVIITGKRKIQHHSKLLCCRTFFFPEFMP